MTHEEPTRGGSYVRNADGSLTLVQRTAAAEPRDKRAATEDAAQPEFRAATVDLGKAAPATSAQE